MKRSVSKRHSRNSLHLLLDNEQRSNRRRNCALANGVLDDDDEDDDDVFAYRGGGCGQGGARRAALAAEVARQQRNVLFEKVAYYEDPGILMIIQSVVGSDREEGSFCSRADIFGCTE